MRCNGSLVDKDTDKMFFWYGMGAKCDVEVIWSRFGMDEFFVWWDEVWDDEDGRVGWFFSQCVERLAYVLDEKKNKRSSF